MSEYSINIDDITKKLDPFPKDKDLPNLKGRLGIITAHLQDLLSDFDSLLPTKVRQEFEMMEKVGVFDYYNLSAWSEKERALKEKIREKRYGLERRLFSGYPPVYDECEFSEEDAIADIAGLDKRLKRYKRFLEKRYGRRIESVIDFHKLKELTELRALLLDQYDRAIDTAGFIEKLEERLLPGSEKNKEIEFDIALWTDERLFPYANNAVNLFMQIADYIRYFDCVPWYLAYPDQYEMLLDDGYCSEEEAKEEEDDVLWEPYDNCLKRKIIRSGDMYSIRQLVFFSEIFRKARQGKLTLEEAFYVHPKTFWGFHEHDELKKVLGLESLWEGVNDNKIWLSREYSRPKVIREIAVQRIANACYQDPRPEFADAFLQRSTNYFSKVVQDAPDRRLFRDGQILAYFINLMVYGEEILEKYGPRNIGEVLLCGAGKRIDPRDALTTDPKEVLQTLHKAGYSAQPF